jgi:hypothetical protein
MATIDPRLEHAVGGRPTGPPRRPRSWDEHELRFERQHPVVWYSPRVMADAGLRYVLGAAFGAYLDKRELQAALPAGINTRHADADECWFDYTADTGDGYNATQTIAWLLGRQALEPEDAGLVLPRGQLLVLGGDEVYPTASPEEYENRFVGPFTAALPWTDGEPPDLYAIPGNHDWFDGLASFMRVFAQQKTVGGWETWQERSYFAVQLPHRWWLWGLDVQFETYIDEPQLRYFDDVPLEPGDRVILCVPEPTWYDVPGDPEEYRNLAYVERKLIRPKGARLLVTLTGDHHHYARYSATDGSHKITAGGGGAFLHGTHDLPDEITLEVDPFEPDEATTYRLSGAYPDRRTSKLLSLRAPLLPFKNASFIWLAGIIHVLLLLTTLFSLRTLEGGEELGADLLKELTGWQLLEAVLINPTAIVVGLLLLGAMFAFAKPPCVRRRYRRPVKLAMATVHVLLHLVGVIAVMWVSVRLVGWFADGTWFAAWLFVVVFALGGVVAAVTMGVYLIGANLLPFLRTHGNEAFSAVRFTRYKNLLRLHIDRDGVLWIHPLGVDKVAKRWRLDPDARDPEAPWVAPVDRVPTVRLIDEVVRVDGRGTPGRPVKDGDVGGQADVTHPGPDRHQDREAAR